MTDAKRSYPQIPQKVWWGIRNMLKTKPSAQISEQLLASSIDVQKTAARQYLSQFVLIGIFDEDGKPTALANKWRIDATYQEALGEIIAQTYPSELVAQHPVGSADADKIKSYFELEGFGAGTAANKAATYVRIANSSLETEPAATEARPKRKKREVAKQKQVPAQKDETEGPLQEAPQARTLDPSLNADVHINLQIHISAEASNDQIEAIFASMGKHLRS